MPEGVRAWDVLLIAGPSGAGKTSVSYPLARRFGVALTEVDDLHITALNLTTPEQQPALHYWFTHPEANELPPGRIVELLVDGGGLQWPFAMLVPSLLRCAQAYELLEDRACDRRERLTLEVLAEPA